MGQENGPASPESRSNPESLAAIALSAAVAVITDSLVETVTDLSLGWRIVVILVLAIAVATGYYLRKHPKQIFLSRLAVNVMTALFAVTIILILLAAVILGLSLGTVAFLVGWLVCMMLLFRIARTLPPAHALPKFLLTIVGAASLGAGLSIGGGPVIGFTAQRSVQLSIDNRCNTALIYDQLQLNVPAHGVQTIAIPAVAMTVEREGGQVVVRGAYDREFRLANPQNATLTFDGKAIGPAMSQTFNLWEQQQHQLIVACP